jgi:[acyl-carrier-protein] S-malonyltransferase
MTEDNGLRKQNKGSKNKVVLMFPGQGSQSIGMGTEFLNENKKYAKYFEIAGDVFGENLLDIINNKDGRGELLDQTQYSQIAIYSLSCALSDYLFSQACFEKSSVKTVTGHSLGDYSALYGCGAFDFRQGAELVTYRGKLMADFAKSGQMMMTAVIGSDFETIESVLKGFSQKVFIANYNDYSQIVISGMAEEVLKASEEIKSRGAKRVLPLKVSIASHCPLMKEVSVNLEKYISQKFQEFSDLNFKFFSSTELSFTAKNQIKETLVNQLVSPVRWVDAIGKVLTDDIAVCIEVGPGKVLSGLVKRIAAKLGREDIMIFNMDSLSEINSLKTYLKDMIYI